MANSTAKFLRNVAGVITEVFGLKSTAGAADAEKLVTTNAAGILDPTLVNATTTSVGAGDAAKIPQLDGTGRLDPTLMPVGVAADVKIIVTSEALAAGDFVNIHDSTGLKVRKADATVNGKRTHGFVLAAVALGGNATVYFEGANTMVTGQTVGAEVFLATVAGTATATAPSAAGNVVQSLGIALSATEINFEPQPPIVVA